MNETILNIAAGKIAPLDLPDRIKNPSFIVNVDPMYMSHVDPSEVENGWSQWKGRNSVSIGVKMDAFEFMERTIIDFDRICIYRFLEHVPFDRVLYFIYLLSTAIKKGGDVDIIVPNYQALAHMILSEEANIANDVINFEAHNILLTTELLNEPSCPHASIWTEYRAQHFFELEGRFKVTDIDEKFEFDGRDIYLRFKAERI